MQVKSPRDYNTEQSWRNLIKNGMKMWSLIWMMMRLVYSPCSHSTKHLEALRCNYHQHLFSSWTFLVRSLSHQTVLLRPWFLLLKPRKPLNFKYRNTTLPRGLSAVCIKWILSDQKKMTEIWEVTYRVWGKPSSSHRVVPVSPGNATHPLLLTCWTWLILGKSQTTKGLSNQTPGCARLYLVHRELDSSIRRSCRIEQGQHRYHLLLMEQRCSRTRQARMSLIFLRHLSAFPFYINHKTINLN